MKANGDSAQDNGCANWRHDLKRLVVSLLLIGALTAIAALTPIREWMSAARIEKLARELGRFGPLLILAIGSVAPLLLVPRWPISWLCGMLYGVTWGSALACVSAMAGAWIQFHFARTLLRPTATRLAARFRWAERSLSEHGTFTAVLLLRLFPFSNFSAVNLIAGTMGGHARAFLAATCIGILPTSIMFAAFGKLAKEPSPGFVIVVVTCLFLFAMVGTAAFFLLKRRMERRAGERNSRAKTPRRKEERDAWTLGVGPKNKL